MAAMARLIDGLDPVVIEKQVPARCNDNAPGAARMAEGPRAPIATLPVVTVAKDGSGWFAGSDGKKTEFEAVRGCEMDLPALVGWLKAGGHKGIILQADRDATAAPIYLVLRSAVAAGGTDVFFAVKR